MTYICLILLFLHHLHFSHKGQSSQYTIWVFSYIVSKQPLAPPLTDNFRILAPANCTICSSNSNTDRLQIIRKDEDNQHLSQLLYFIWMLQLLFLNNTVFDHFSLAVLVFNSASTVWFKVFITIGRHQESYNHNWKKFTDIFLRISLSKFPIFISQNLSVFIISCPHMSWAIMEMCQEKVCLVWGD